MKHRILMIEPTIRPVGVEMFRESCDVYMINDGSEESLIHALNEYKIEGLITRAEKITRKIIESTPTLKAIGQYGVGTDNIDVAAASENGVMVLNVPDGNYISVAEHAMTFILALSRHIVAYDPQVRAGNWKSFREAVVPSEVYEKTLMIIGLGRIGRAVATRAQAFGMKVIAYDPFISADKMAPLDIEKVDTLEEGVKHADFITIQLHLTPETRGLFNAKLFKNMKKTAYLLNLSRGPVVNEGDLYDALVSGEIAGAALDVMTQEPPENDNPLFKLPNVIFTPHVAGNAVDALDRISRILGKTVVEALDTGDSYNFMNKNMIQNKR